jgi:hypothetical protein
MVQQRSQGAGDSKLNGGETAYAVEHVSDSIDDGHRASPRTGLQRKRRGESNDVPLGVIDSSRIRRRLFAGVESRTQSAKRNCQESCSWRRSRLLLNCFFVPEHAERSNDFDITDADRGSGSARRFIPCALFVCRARDIAAINSKRNGCGCRDVSCWLLRHDSAYVNYFDLCAGEI